MSQRLLVPFGGEAPSAHHLGKAHLGLYFAILAGLIAGVLIGKATEYYTSDTYKPTQELSGKSQTGSATIIIGGLGLGMLSTALPIVWFDWIGPLAP